jgi:cell fate regulator YaaT (PSP1 superfamily)
VSEETQETQQITQNGQESVPAEDTAAVPVSEEIQEIEVAPEEIEVVPEESPSEGPLPSRRRTLVTREETLDAEDIVNFRELREGAAPLPGHLAHIRLTDLAAPILCRTNDLALDVNDFCVVKNPDGEEVTGYVLNFPLPAAFQLENRPVWNILRKADSSDVHNWHQLRRREREAMVACKQKTVLHKLDMKVSQVRFDDRAHKVIFYFTADKRVDFRELVKDLASTFHARIELWQVGVRDEAKQVGGLGCCGRQMCCCSWMREFMPVSIRYAKVQDIQFSPTKLSGVCGRLRCCLSYEQDQYVEMAHDAPAIGAVVESAQYGNAKVVDRNLLSRVAVITSEEGKYVTIPFAQMRLLDKGDPKAKANKKSTAWQLLTEAEVRAAADDQASEHEPFPRPRVAEKSSRGESSSTPSWGAGKPGRRAEPAPVDRSVASMLDSEDEAWIASQEREEEEAPVSAPVVKAGGRDRDRRPPNPRGREGRGERDPRGKDRVQEKESVPPVALVESEETGDDVVESAGEDGDKDGAQKARRRRSRRRRGGSGQPKDPAAAAAPGASAPPVATPDTAPNHTGGSGGGRSPRPQHGAPNHPNSEKTPDMHKNKKHPERKAMRPPQHSRHN